VNTTQRRSLAYRASTLNSALSCQDTRLERGLDTEYSEYCTLAKDQRLERIGVMEST
jgi:hypothetical protein